MDPIVRIMSDFRAEPALGLFLFVFAGVPSATLAIMGRFAVNISYNIGLQYAAELLPTVVRAQGVALIHIMGYVASILAPFVVYLVSIDAFKLYTSSFMSGIWYKLYHADEA